MSDNAVKTGNEPEKTSVFDNMLKIIGVPLAGFVGWAYGHLSLRDSVFSRLKKYGAFKDFVPEHEAELKNLVSFKPGAKHEVVQEIKTIHKKYGKQIKDRMHEKGFKNTFDLWKGAHDTERTEAGLIAFTAAGITIGAIVALANSKSLFNMFSKKEQASEPASQAK